jgi:fatty acid CoA ligase FadD9
MIAPSTPSNDRTQRRVAELYAAEPGVREAAPLPSVAEAIRRPGLPLTRLVDTVMAAYSNRPAIGERARELVSDPTTGRTTLALLPRYDTISYGELWSRSAAVAAEWHGHQAHPVRANEFVGILGVGSADFVTVDLACLRLGAVSVPMQSSATAANLTPIIAETAQRVLTAQVQFLDTAVDCALTSSTLRRLIVLDYHSADDDEREIVDAARARLSGSPVTLETLTEVMACGTEAVPAPEFVADPADEHVSLLIYTSGSTGTPKGAIYTDRQVRDHWLTVIPRDHDGPVIHVNFLPLSHMMGRGVLFNTLAAGGTACFTAASDLSTLFEDLSLVRPTELGLVPRVADALFQHYTNDVDRRTAGSGDRAGAEAAAKADIRERLLGGRVVWTACGSAPMSPEMTEFVESCTGVPMHDLYGSTEAAVIMKDNTMLRPPVRDYRLEDVPELGYFTTDTPYPRGELLVKTDLLFPGYYRRPDVTAEVFDTDGYYRTGDIMAELAPDRLTYVDRRSNVLKLAQGEFVAVSRLEALFVNSPLIRQIYVYGNSERAYLLAVIVPAPEALLHNRDLETVLRDALRDVAATAGLNSYEVPRDFLVETEPFSTANGLLSGIRKLLRPALKQRYADRLEQLYTDLAAHETRELQSLRDGGRDQPTLPTVQRAARAVLNITDEVAADARFLELGGDSLSALSFANLLREIFDVDVTVDLVISSANTLRRLAEYIDTALRSASTRPTVASVHASGTVVRASELTLDAFLDPGALAAASDLPKPGSVANTVLLTGANGYLGRFLCLEWLERMAERGGKLICLVRGSDADAARARLTDAFDSGDAALLRHFHELADDHLDVLAGDIGEPGLGLDERTWDLLASSVDLIVHPAALVNHVLPYDQLFGPNVLGTAEVIRLALATRIKPVTFLSTVAVLAADTSTPDEDADIRESSPLRHVNDGYAYG